MVPDGNDNAFNSLPVMLTLAFAIVAGRGVFDLWEFLVGSSLSIPRRRSMGPILLVVSSLMRIVRVLDSVLYRLLRPVGWRAGASGTENTGSEAQNLDRSIEQGRKLLWSMSLLLPSRIREAAYLTAVDELQDARTAAEANVIARRQAQGMLNTALRKRFGQEPNPAPIWYSWWFRLGAGVTTTFELLGVVSSILQVISGQLSLLQAVALIILLIAAPVLGIWVAVVSLRRQQP